MRRSFILSVVLFFVTIIVVIISYFIKDSELNITDLISNAEYKVEKDSQSEVFPVEDLPIHESSSYDIVVVAGEELFFRRYSKDNKVYIEARDSMPALYTHKDAKLFLFVFNNNLYSINLDLEVAALTSDTYFGYTIYDYFNHVGNSIFWADAPKLSPDGTKAIYYSNKDIVNGKPALMDSLRLVQLNEQEEPETILLNNRMLEQEGSFLSPYVEWIDNDFILVKVINSDGSIQFMKYSTNNKESEDSMQIQNYITFNHHYVVYREHDQIKVLNVNDWSTVSYTVDEVGIEHMVTVSNEGIVAYPYSNQIAILSKYYEQEKTLHTIPFENAIYEQISFMSEDKLLVKVQDKTEHLSWILNIEVPD